MTFVEFKKSLDQKEPPPHLIGLPLSLWYDAKGNWEKAHQIAQDIETPDRSWVHAFLHRREGDLSNASYWYHRAKKSIPDRSLAEEWESIVKSLLH